MRLLLEVETTSGGRVAKEVELARGLNSLISSRCLSVIGGNWGDVLDEDGARAVGASALVHVAGWGHNLGSGSAIAAISVRGGDNALGLFLLSNDWLASVDWAWSADDGLGGRRSSINGLLSGSVGDWLLPFSIGFSGLSADHDNGQRGGDLGQHTN